MPYLVNVGTRGSIKKNKSRVGSRGYHIYRRKNIVVCRWGSISVRYGKKIVFMWTGEPAEKRYRYQSEEDAASNYEKKLKKMQLPHEGYNRLPKGNKICPYIEGVEIVFTRN